MNKVLIVRGSESLFILLKKLAAGDGESSDFHHKVDLKDLWESELFQAATSLPESLPKEAKTVDQRMFSSCLLLYLLPSRVMGL